MRIKKVPLRKCVACQDMKAKNELVRIVKTPDNEIVIDQTGKKSGRGAYLCQSQLCIDNAQKHRSLERALKQAVDKAIYEQLGQQYNE